MLVVVPVGDGVGVSLGAGCGVEVSVGNSVLVGIDVGVSVDVCVGVFVGVGLAVLVCVAVGVAAAATKMTREVPGTPLLKTVTNAWPGGNPVTGSDVNAVFENMLELSGRRNCVCALITLRN